MADKIKKIMCLSMTDRGNGIFYLFFGVVLSLISYVYSAVIKVIDICYRLGIRKVRKVGVPVVSVGNLTLGGTGKTPFTLMLAEYFHGKGKDPAILIRGYGLDENRMLEQVLPDIPIYVGRDRIKSAERAISDGRDIIILDDGYQHRTLYRDVDVLLFDSEKPFGNRKLFPRGVLREQVSSVSRADLGVITKADKVTQERLEYTKDAIQAASGDLPLCVSAHRPVMLMDITGTGFPPETISGKKVMLVSGIGDPGYFENTVKGLDGKVLETLIYSDHHDYDETDIKAIFQKSEGSGVEYIITTEKDLVKLKELDISSIEERLLVLRVELNIIEGREDFFVRLDSILYG